MISHSWAYSIEFYK